MNYFQSEYKGCHPLLLVSYAYAITSANDLILCRCGEIKRLVMGLDRFNKTPCGFCFVEYYTHQDALDCLKYIGGTKLDERIVRTDLDPGFEEGRQYGYVLDSLRESCFRLQLTERDRRGKSGGQVRDEYRDDYDPGRGGYGRAELRAKEREKEREYDQGR